MARTPISYSKRDFLDSFKKKNPDIVVNTDTSTETFAEIFYNILNTAGKKYAEALLEDGEVKLGNRLGPLNIRKFKPKGKGTNFAMPTDPNLSKKHKKAVYQFNDHTDGWMYRFIWNKRKCKSVMDKNMWVFKPIRSLKRALAALLKQGLKDYPIATKEL